MEVRERPLTQDLLPSSSSLYRTRVTLFRQLVFVRGLGCTVGCSFCATSHHFRQRRVSLCSARELFSAVERRATHCPDINSAIIYDEDFLADPANVDAFREGMARNDALRKRPFWLTIFATVRSIRRYSTREILECGIGTVFIGVESLQDDVIEDEGLTKRRGAVQDVFRELHEHGINTLGSLVVGWDGQSATAAENDCREFVALNPTFYQVVPLHPVPGTPLWERIKAEHRLIDDYRIEEDGIADFNFELRRFSRDKARELVSGTYAGLVDEGGPWPFRVATNLLQGFLSMRNAESELFQEEQKPADECCSSCCPSRSSVGSCSPARRFADDTAGFAARSKPRSPYAIDSRGASRWRSGRCCWW